MDSPCKQCKFVGCGFYHERCEKYQEFKKERILMYECRKKNNIIEYARLDHSRRKIGGRR